MRTLNRALFPAFLGIMAAASLAAQDSVTPPSPATIAPLVRTTT